MADYDVTVGVKVDLSELRKNIESAVNNFDTMVSKLNKNQIKVDSDPFKQDVIRIRASLKELDDAFKSTSKGAKQLGADMNLLGIGFLGFQIQSFFTPILQMGTETFLGLSAGTNLLSDNMATLFANFEYFKFLFGDAVLGALGPFLGVANSVLEWFNSLGSESRTVVASLVIIGAAFGYIVSQGAFFLLGLESLISIWPKVSAFFSELGTSISTITWAGAAEFIGTLLLLLATIYALKEGWTWYSKAVEDADTKSKYVPLWKKYVDELGASILDMNKGWFETKSSIELIQAPLKALGISFFYAAGIFITMMSLAIDTVLLGFKKLYIELTILGKSWINAFVDNITNGINSLLSSVSLVLEALRTPLEFAGFNVDKLIGDVNKGKEAISSIGNSLKLDVSKDFNDLADVGAQILKGQADVREQIIQGGLDAGDKIFGKKNDANTQIDNAKKSLDFSTFLPTSGLPNQCIVPNYSNPQASFVASNSNDANTSISKTNNSSNTTINLNLDGFSTAISNAMGDVNSQVDKLLDMVNSKLASTMGSNNMELRK